MTPEESQRHHAKVRKVAFTAAGFGLATSVTALLRFPWLSIGCMVIALTLLAFEMRLIKRAEREELQ